MLLFKLRVKRIIIIILMYFSGRLSTKIKIKIILCWTHYNKKKTIFLFFFFTKQMSIWHLLRVDLVIFSLIHLLIGLLLWCYSNWVFSNLWDLKYKLTFSKINRKIEQFEYALLMSDTIPLSVTLVSHKFNTCKLVRWSDMIKSPESPN